MQDYKESLFWVRKAAQANHINAQYSLGTFLAKGLGTPKNLPEAAFWLSLAAAKGETHAVENRDVVMEMLSTAERDDVKKRLEIELADNPINNKKIPTR